MNLWRNLGRAIFVATVAFAVPAGGQITTEIAEAARPIDDVRGSAAYRRHACAVLARRALAWALDDRRAARGAP